MVVMVTMVMIMIMMKFSWLTHLFQTISMWSTDPRVSFRLHEVRNEKEEEDDEDGDDNVKCWYVTVTRSCLAGVTQGAS